MDDSTPTLWAKVKSELSLAQKQVLDAHGLTWETFFEVERDVLSSMSSDSLETEYGTIQKIPDSPVQYRVRKSSSDEVFHKKRLKLVRKQ